MTVFHQIMGNAEDAVICLFPSLEGGEERYAGTLFQTFHPLAQSLNYERFLETAHIAFVYSAFFSAFRLCRLLPYGLSVISCSISKPLADDTLHRSRGTFHVIYAEPNAIAIAEIVLGEITMQMLLAAMLVDALHAALENREIAFNRVGGDDPVA